MYRLFHICDAVASLEDKDVGRISDPVPARTYLHVGALGLSLAILRQPAFDVALSSRS